MVVDGRGNFMSQRTHPRLALVRPAIRQASLEIEAPGMDPISLGSAADRPTLQVTVWRDTVPALDEGAEAAAWFSDYLKTEARLVRFDPRARRYCNTAFAGDSGAHTGFSDAYPLLFLSEATLADLNSRLQQSLPMNRFRPNVVLGGVEAYDEDHFGEVRVGNVAFKPVKPCTRCQVTTIEQTTAEAGVEPLPTLAGYRMDARLGGVTFGINAIVSAGAGSTVSVGSPADCTLAF